MLYIPSKDNKSRFALGKPGSRSMIIFGINPSTATDTRFDHTIRKIEKFSRLKKFDGWIVLNIYPQRTADANKLDVSLNHSLHKSNIEEIEKILQRYSPSKIFAAWGDNISIRQYLIFCLKDIVKIVEKITCEWARIGEFTKLGNPRHPSRLSYSERMHEFDINKYLIKYSSQ